MTDLSAAPVFGGSRKWARYVGMGGEVTAEWDGPSDHHHVYLSSFEDNEEKFVWCGECSCWVDGACDHENRNICRERREAVL